MPRVTRSSQAAVAEKKQGILNKNNENIAANAGAKKQLKRSSKKIESSSQNDQMVNSVKVLRSGKNQQQNKMGMNEKNLTSKTTALKDSTNIANRILKISLVDEKNAAVKSKGVESVIEEKSLFQKRVSRRNIDNKTKENKSQENQEKNINDYLKNDCENSKKINENSIIENENKKNDFFNSKNKVNFSDKNKEVLKNTKKFFKTIVPKEDIAVSVNIVPEVSKRKKKNVRDSSFKCTSTVVAKKNEVKPKSLRPRANKNYCEESKIFENDKNKNENLVYKNSDNTKENIEKINAEKVYEFSFSDDSQSNEENKKIKKPLKKTLKRLKNKAGSKPILKKNKVIKTNYPKTGKPIPKTESLGKKVKALPIKTVTADAVKKVVADPVTKINEDLVQEIGENTLQEASTIITSPKIKSIETLEGQRRISLMATPPVPKTAASELKLFGPKNVFTSQTSSQYNKMENHSLIRRSMSPIDKLIEDNYVESPEKIISDNFSRVKQVVQSTPQVNRKISIAREKRMKTEVNKESKNNKNNYSNIEEEVLSNNKNTFKTPVKNKVVTATVSPRKFGTDITNSPSPVKMSSFNNSPQKTLLSSTRLSNKSISSRRSLQESLNNQPTITKNNLSKVSSFKAVKPLQENVLKSSFKRQSNLDNFLNIEEMPKPEGIKTPHGIFDDINSTPVRQNTKPMQVEELSVENAFGFDDADMSDVSPIKNNLPASPIIQKSKKGKLFRDNVDNKSPNEICNNVKSRPVVPEAKKIQIEDLNVENAFGFDDINDVSPVEKDLPTSSIVTENDVKKSKKGKLFRNARVKSFLPSRITANQLKNVLLKKDAEEKDDEKEKDKENDKYKDESRNNSDLDSDDSDKRKENQVVESLLFSDTFDIQSSNDNIVNKVPDEMPLFVDLEPVHFKQPPRKSYTKRKRDVHFDSFLRFSDDDNDDESDNESKKKRKKKKMNKKCKQEKETNKQYNEWAEEVNKTFEQIDNFDLCVE